MKKPECLVQWEMAEPQVCWNCNFCIRSSGRCAKFDANPPDDFMEANRACGGWEQMDIPF